MVEDTPQNLRILCVDSDPDSLIILELALAFDFGIEPIMVSTFAATLATLARAQPIDVVLLASSMLIAHGRLLLDHIVKTDGSPPTPVILLVDDSYRADIASPGIVGIIGKPVHPTRLARELRAILKHVGKSSRY